MEVLRTLEGRAWSGEGAAARGKPMDAMGEAGGGRTPAWEILLGGKTFTGYIWLIFSVKKNNFYTILVFFKIFSKYKWKKWINNTSNINIKL